MGNCERGDRLRVLCSNEQTVGQNERRCGGEGVLSPNCFGVFMAAVVVAFGFSVLGGNYHHDGGVFEGPIGHGPVWMAFIVYSLCI